MVSLDYGVTASHRRHSAGCPYLLFIRGYDHHIRSPALARQCSFCLRIRPPRAVRRLDCLDPGGVIKWRASERVSLVRQRSWNFATRDSRAPQLACWTAGRYEDGGLVPPDHLTSSFKGIQTDGQIIVARHCTAVMEWMDH